MSPDRRLPVVYLHIGTMKSGTSYIQTMLSRNREELRANGVLYPGRTWQDQVNAVRDVTRARGQGARPDVRGQWDALRDEMLAWQGERVVLSMELLSLADPERVQAAVESLAPAEVHAVVTARDLVRVLPSAWQESTQNRQTWTWPAYVSSVTGESDDEPLAFKRFWRQHDVAQITATWSAAVGRDRVHVVVVPPSGGPRDELWRRFCSVVGLDAAAYEGADEVRGNPAVGAASAEFLRRLNVELDRDIDIATYERLVKRFLAKTVLSHRTTESRLVLPDRYLPWAVDRAHQMIEALRENGVAVAGDLAELIPTAVPPTPPTCAGDPQAIAADEVVDAGLHALTELVLKLAQPAPTGGRDRPAARRS